MAEGDEDQFLRDDMIYHAPVTGSEFVEPLELLAFKRLMRVLAQGNAKHVI